MQSLHLKQGVCPRRLDLALSLNLKRLTLVRDSSTGDRMQRRTGCASQHPICCRCTRGSALPGRRNALAAAAVAGPGRRRARCNEQAAPLREELLLAHAAAGWHRRHPQRYPAAGNTSAYMDSRRLRSAERKQTPSLPYELHNSVAASWLIGRALALQRTRTQYTAANYK